jgi:hypothetical protein
MAVQRPDASEDIDFLYNPGPIVADLPWHMRALRMSYRRHSAGFLAGLLLCGCSELSLPQRGFATRFFHSTLEPSLDPPTDFGGSALVAPDGRSLSPDSCEAIARARAQDSAAQYFSSDVQNKVFDGTLADCRNWRARFAGTVN